ncbi:hypothetical protein [Streptomyces adelaidensis]|uniref:hypothetical protein n=1 Tax=Streptomyces adelaidensis TaxID=2796465 RepID=UPI001903AB7B|nr:hypothetical protein [Streptomyces adelaidensis]
MPITTNVTTSVRLRPKRSPKWPRWRRPGTGEEADGEGGERAELTGDGVVGGEEQRAEVRAGEQPVQAEVVELDGGADRAGQCDPPRLLGVGGRRTL